jgi:AAA family ATP:ADP antiporter
VVDRLGDQAGAWSYAGLGALGRGAAAVSVAAVPLSAAWLVNSLWLGRAQERRHRAARAAEAPGYADGI